LGPSRLGVLVLTRHIEATQAVALVSLGGFGYLLEARPRRRRIPLAEYGELAHVLAGGEAQGLLT
jgi:hypothetical protein